MSEPRVAPVDPSLLDEAVALAVEAGALTRQWFGRVALEVEQKGDGTPVTAADRAAERFLREEIGRRWSDDAILGEEEPPVAGRSGRRWVIDPIDGTKAFIRGVPLYSTLLALEDEHGPAIGIVVLPALESVVWAGRGRGCWHDGQPAHVNSHASVDGALVTTSGFDNWSVDTFSGVKNAGALLRTWGDGYGYALVATGRADAMIDPTVAHYDVAAMPVLLSEAGGVFTNMAGVPGSDGGSGIAANPALHAALLPLFG